MKPKFILTGAIALFAACSTLNKIITIDDDFKNEKSIRLIQELDGISDEKRGGIWKTDYTVKLKTLYLKPEKQPGYVLAELTVNTEARPENLDSLIFLEVDGEKFTLATRQNKSVHFVDHSTSTSTTTSTETEEEEEEKEGDENKSEKTLTTTETTINSQARQVMKLTSEIPAQAWEKIRHSEQIRMRFYIENEGVTVRFTPRERKKFKGLFLSIPENDKLNGI